MRKCSRNYRSNYRNGYGKSNSNPGFSFDVEVLKNNTLKIDVNYNFGKNDNLSVNMGRFYYNSENDNNKKESY